MSNISSDKSPPVNLSRELKFSLARRSLPRNAKRSFRFARAYPADLKKIEIRLKHLFSRGVQWGKTRGRIMIEQQSRKKQEVKRGEKKRGTLARSSIHLRLHPFSSALRLLATRSFSSISTIGKAITRYVGHKSNCQSVSPSLSRARGGSFLLLRQLLHPAANDPRRFAFYLESTSCRGINSRSQTTRA